MKKSSCLAILLSFLASALAFATPVKSENDAIKLVVDAIHKFHLMTLKDECSVLNIFDKSSYFDVVVRERHGDGCDVSPETAPRLFSVRVRKHDGRLTSDVYDGVRYRLVNHKPRATSTPSSKP